MSSGLTIEKRGVVAILTLHNPAKRHALNLEILESLNAALPDLPGDGIRAAVLTSSGPLFSAGFDVDLLPEEPDDTWLRKHGILTELFRLISEGPVPVVAALPGAAIGAGCDLALSCDLRVSHPGVTLCMPPVRLGLIYTPEGVSRLMSLCGAARARRMLLTAQPIDATTAESWGLIDAVVPEDEVLPTALKFAELLAEQPRPALLGTRLLIERILREGPTLSAASAAEFLELRRQAWQSDIAKEARKTFRDRLKKRST